MRELLTRLLYITLAIALFTPSLLSAQGLVPCDFCNFCHLLQLANNLIHFGMEVLVAPLVVIAISWTGVLYLTAQGDRAKVRRANSALIKILIGVVLVFFSWLIVDTIMKSFAGNIDFGFWRREIQCPAETGPGVPQPRIFPPIPPFILPPPPPRPPAAPPGSIAMCLPTNLACSPLTLQALGYTPAQANAMSCIAMTESSGIPTLINPNGGACGTFQILPSNWAKPALHQGACSAATDCRNAACNEQTAFLLTRARIAAGQSPYLDWTCPGCNARAQACVNTFDPGF